MLRRWQRDVPRAVLDPRVPLRIAAAGLVVEVAAEELGDAVVEASRMERRPVDLHEAAAPACLLLELVEAVAHVERVVGLAVVAAVRDEDDGIGIVEGARIRRPAL